MKALILPLCLLPLFGAGLEDDCMKQFRPLPDGLILEKHLALAKGGNLTSMFCAGAINLYVRKDNQNALHWLELAGNQGESRAAFILGILYEKGTGVAANPALAAKWYEMAARQGAPPAMRRLSELYRYGIGVPKSAEKAEYWSQQALKAGDTATGEITKQREKESRLPAANIYAEATQLYKLKRMPEATAAFARCAQMGNALCQLQLGWHYEEGAGVARDYAQAVTWYRKAADQGDETAQKNLGQMYEYGLGVAENWAEAYRWYQRSASQGYAEAEFSIGRVFEFGMGLPQNRAAAITWFQKAGSHGHAQGAYFARFLSDWTNCIGFRNDNEQRTLGFGRCPADPAGVAFRNSQERIAYLAQKRTYFDAQAAYTSWSMNKDDYDRCMNNRTQDRICYNPGPAPRRP